MDLYSLIIKVPDKGRAAGPSSRPGEKMVEEKEELVRRARETLRDSITRQGVEVIM